LFGLSLLCVRPSEAAEPGGMTIERDLVYAKPDGVELKLDAYLPKEPGDRPAVLVVHGGAWRTGSKRQLAGYAQRLSENGYAAFAINYRLAPKYVFPAQIEDCRSALEWICRNADRLRIDAARLGAIGYSAGGHLVTLLATDNGGDAEPDKPHPRLRAVVAGGAPCDFREIPPQARGLAFWLGDTRERRPDAYRAASPAAFVTPDDTPIFFFHGEVDQLVNVAGVRTMVEILKREKVETQLYVIPKAGHIEAVFDQEALHKALAFFDERLKSKE
jgi:triacylglycerol lipase